MTQNEYYPKKRLDNIITFDPTRNLELNKYYEIKYLERVLKGYHVLLGNFKDNLSGAIDGGELLAYSKDYEEVVDQLIDCDVKKTTILEL